jgi:hypothetical protein
VSKKGCDSAEVPSETQIETAIQQGVNWWGFYVAGPGAYHNWPASGIDVLRKGGISKGLPIYVPQMSYGKIVSQTPEADAQGFVGVYRLMGVDGAGVLDTEESMRGDPWTAQYERRFAAELRNLGQADITYAGGFTLDNPPSATYRWWIIDSDNPPSGVCYQQGQSSFAGLEVDVDYAGDDFPLALFTQPHPQPPGPVSTLSQVMKTSPRSGLPVVACRTTDSSLYLFWQTPDAQWHGPLGIGQSNTVTKDDISLDFDANGLIQVSHTGPTGLPYFYWQTNDAQIHGPYGL